MTALVSCNKKKNIKEILTSEAGDYWTYYYPIPHVGEFTYYKFDKNNMSQRYERDNTNRFYKYSGEGDVVEVSQKWSVSKDSILRFNGLTYDIVSYNENCIVLYFKDEKSKDERIVFLTKEKENNPRNYSDYYYERRQKHPEKYTVPDSWW